MKNQYWIALGPCHVAIADLVKVHAGVWMLTRINVPHAYRGQGFGRQLLQMILDDADRFSQTIELGILDSGGLSHAQLEEWYRRNGFEEVNRNTWSRSPRKLTQVES